MRGPTLLVCCCLLPFAAVLAACGASNQPANDQTTVTVTPPSGSAPAAPSTPGTPATPAAPSH